MSQRAWFEGDKVLFVLLFRILRQSFILIPAISEHRWLFTEINSAVFHSGFYPVIEVCDPREELGRASFVACGGNRKYSEKKEFAVVEFLRQATSRISFARRGELEIGSVDADKGVHIIALVRITAA